MVETLKIVWSIFKLGKMIYTTYFDDNPISSGCRAIALKQAMEAVDAGDVLKLNAAIEYFGRMSEYTERHRDR